MLRGFLFLLALSGCTYTPHPGARFGVPVGSQVIAQQGSQSGIQRFTTQEREIYRDATGIMTARPVILQRGTLRQYAVLTNVRRRAPNGPRLVHVATHDRLLDYRRHDRIYSHCIDGCQRAEIGAIYLSEADFRTAERDGLYLLADGARQSYEGTVPAEAFAHVRAAADAPGSLQQIRDVMVPTIDTEP
ncbi:hypothetical protein LGQ03_02670 [Loktanella sp. TSTF-M6]|uniref:LPS-assembly lipoprotein n=1 Tax=Loktanella gaetbuli TaxID=2881335 RepID=A0ABS8BRA8_9RHOB|nr:hypothetical protein [Loktanella gaetbuli]MCB5198134.1 hypothetical protein [Loktanella gaetbuli]